MMTAPIRNSANERLFDIAVDERGRLWIVVKSGKQFKIIEYEAMLRQISKLTRV